MCAPKTFDEATRPPTLLNPTVLIEITSESTRSRDFSDKLETYFRLESLLEYWIVEADRPHVLHYERTEGGVLVHMIQGAEQTLKSAALDIAIPLRELYRRVLSRGL